MTELELHQPTNDLSVQMDYARAVSSASLLPDNYRNKPADIMLAVGLGQSMGLSPAESLYRIHVIKGKPTASAELIASNVRKAGHRLRTVVDAQGLTATTSIWRADDPDFEHSVTRDMEWAKRMGLLSNDNYIKQPSTMLANRSITACARIACPEALYGISYSAEEMGDLPGVQSSGLGAVLHQTSEPDASPTEETSDDVAGSGSESPLLTNTTAFGKAFYARMKERNFDSDQQRLEYVCETVGRFVASTKELTEAEARLVLARLDDEDAIDAEVVA